MKLAITTYNYFGIFDTESHDLQILDEGKGKYFGITWDENFLYATVGVRLNLGEQYGQKKERILVFDKALKRQSDFFESDIGLNNVHQLFDTGETMWVANSGKNRIEIIDKELKTIKHWYPFFFKRNKDINHLNSIFIKDNKLYLLAHNNQKPSIAYEYSYPKRKLVRKIKIGSQAHNLYVTNENEIFVCDSNGSGNVISEKGNDFKVGVGYVRGLAASMEYLFVGSSNKAEREERQNGDCAIYVFDRLTRELKDKLKIPKAGNIYDIRILDQPDYCHHKQIFNQEE